MRVEIRFSELGRAAAEKTLAWRDAGGHEDDRKFNMMSWKDIDENCGTLCCIGGHMDIASGRTFTQNSNDYFESCSSNKARMNTALFYANYERPLDMVTVEEAATQLRCALEHGYVDWNI